MIRIALFGEPGTGKTTVAHTIAALMPCNIIEASQAIIYPLAKHAGTLPSEHALMAHSETFLKPTRTPVSREQARDIFAQLTAQYGNDAIAKLLHARYVEKPKYTCLIFTGMRGYDNAAYCRLHNDFVVYLTTHRTQLIARLCKERGYTEQQAASELHEEQKMFNTRAIKSIANLTIDTSDSTPRAIAQTIINKLNEEYRMCARCINTAKNPAITFNKDGLCTICSAFTDNFDPQHLKQELRFIQSFKGTGAYDAFVGISGGKDSTATLWSIKNMGFTPLAFTFDLGYLPATTIPRARNVARMLGVDHEVIDIKPYIRAIDRAAYEKTARLFELPFTLETKHTFKQAYREGRKHYSIKCGHAPAFVRSCQICRRMVIRAYHAEARKRDINLVVLGINEWTNLSAAQRGGAYKVSGIRTLHPSGHKPVYVVHLPFMLQRTSAQTKRIVNKLGWKPPEGEDFIESNANSCLFARATERMAKRLLEFHPDSTRLAREVTVGFITKQQALRALKKIHPYHLSPREVLERAGILTPKQHTSKKTKPRARTTPTQAPSPPPPP